MADSLRIDRWLFYCRFFRTRVRATEAVAGGHVKLNGERAAPGNRVSCGDRIDLVRERKNLEAFRKEHWEGSFEDYLKLVEANPRLTREPGGEIGRSG